MGGRSQEAFGLFRLLCTGLALLLNGQYAFELWLFLTRRRARLRSLVREMPITSGEVQDGPPVTIRNRLFFSWPLIILITDIVLYALWTRY
jgi:hypothetical protein